MRVEENMENIQEELQNLLDKVHDVISCIQKIPTSPDVKDILVEELMSVSKNLDDGITSTRKIIGYLP
jgi:hypothetical protein